MPNIPAVIRPQDQYINSIGSMLQGSGSGFIGPTFNQPSSTPSPTPKPVAPKKITYGNTAATSPKQQYVDSLSAYKYEDDPTVYGNYQGNPDYAFHSEQEFKGAGGNFGNVAVRQRPVANMSVPDSAGNTSSQPTTPGTPIVDPMKGYKDAYEKYIASLAPSPELTGAKQKYADFLTQQDQGVNEIRNKPIASQFVQGQEAGLLRQNQATEANLQRQIGLATDYQTVLANQGNARVTYEKSLLDQSKPTEVGGSLVRLNPQTGQYESVYSAPQKPIELGAGATLIDPTTGKALYSNPATPSYQANPLTGELFDSKTGLPFGGGLGASSGSGGSFPSGAQTPGSAAAVNNPLGIKPNGKFSQYATPAEGFQAGVDLVKKYQTGGPKGMNANSTLDQMIKTWITGDPNSTRKTGYTASNVAQFIGGGVTPSTKIGSIDPVKLAAAIAKFETGFTQNAGGNLGNDIIGTLAQQVLQNPQVLGNLPSAQQTAVIARLAQAGQQVPANTKPPSDSQYQSSIYATRVQQAGSIIDSLESKIASMNPLTFEYNNHVPSYLQSSDYQSYDQAARNLINSVLRRESGAAISSGEFDNAYKQYLPRAGDTAQTLAQKKQNREAILNGLIQSSANAYNGQIPSNNNIPSGATPDYGSIYGF